MEAALTRALGATKDDRPAALAALSELSSAPGAVGELVVALRPQLTGADEEKRLGGTLLLADVIALLPAEALPQETIEHLVSFFNDRLSDYLTIGGVLRALFALAPLPLPSGSPLKVLTTLLEACDVRSLAQADRQAAMSLVFELVRWHWPALAPSGCRLLLGVVRAIDGEKDPRNLVLYLQLLRELIVRCEESGADGLAEALDEVFDSMACYFPITFTPPPNDPHQITPHHLLQALLRTLRSTPKLAPHAVPFFAKRLRETASEGEEEWVRLQALQSVAILAPAFGARALAPHAEAVGEGMAELLSAAASSSSIMAAVAANGPATEALGAMSDVMCAALGAALRAVGLAMVGGAPAAAAEEEAEVAAGGGQPGASAQGVAAQSATQSATQPATEPGELGRLLERLVAPSVSRCISARPSGPGAADGGRLLTELVAASPPIAAVVLEQALAPLVRRVASDPAASQPFASADAAPSGPAQPSPEQADALALLLSLLTAAIDAHAAVADPAAAELIAAPLRANRPQILAAAARVAERGLGAPAGRVLLHALSAPPPPAGSTERDGLDESTRREALAALGRAIFSAVDSATPIDEPALAQLAGAAARAEGGWRLAGGWRAVLAEEFDAAIRAPLIARFASASAAAPDDAGDDVRMGDFEAAASLGRLVGAASEGSSPRHAAGVQALVNTALRTTAGILDPTASARPAAPLRLAGSCFEALAALYEQAPEREGLTTAARDLVSTALLPELVAALRAAAAEQSLEQSLSSVIDMLLPLWAELCASPPAAGAAPRPLLDQCAEWLLPPPDAAAAAASRRLRPLLLAALVNSPREQSLPPGALAALATLCASDAASDTELRCLCVAHNKWASDSQLDDALNASHAAASSGSVPALKVWLRLGRAAACRGGGWTAAVSASLIDLIAMPPPAAPQPAWGDEAMAGVGLLMSPPEGLLLKQRGARLLPLLAQRLHAAYLPKLRAAHAAAASGSDARAALLHATVVATTLSPLATLSAQPVATVPLLLEWVHSAAARARSADAPAQALLTAVLRVLTVMLGAISEAEIEGTSSLLPPLLQLLDGCPASGAVALAPAAPIASPAPPLEIGALEAALECLEACHVMPYHRLFPHKRRVLLALQPSLDHRKRRVRQAARKCANQWHVLKRIVQGGGCG